jgi:hypothetical protein
MAKNTSTDGAAQAPVTMNVERQGQYAEPYVIHYPQVRAGTCEFCGVIDPNVPAHSQYKLCGHYRGKQLACSYCDATKDPNEVNGKSVLNIVAHPDKPNTLIVVCDSYDCSRAHQARFQRKSA